MNWFVFCILSVFSLATAELLQQQIINRGSKAIDDKISGFLTFGMITLLMSPLVVFYYRTNTFVLFSYPVFFYFLATCFMSALGTLFYLKSFKVKSISYSTIFVSTSAIFSTLLGIMIYNESVSLVKFLGIILILGAIVLINITSETFEKQSLWGLGAGFFYGLMYICDKWFVLQIDPLLYLFWSVFFTTIFLFFLNLNHISKTVPKLKVRDLRLIVISGVAYITYNLLTFLAYINGGEVGVVDAINNSQIFLIILFELFILKQKQSVLRKIVSFLIALIGIYILGNLT